MNTTLKFASMKSAFTQMIVAAAALVALSGTAQARTLGGRVPASDITRSLKKKLVVKDHHGRNSIRIAKHTKTTNLANEVDPTSQRDLTFESHHSVENEAEGVTKRVAIKISKTD